MSVALFLQSISFDISDSRFDMTIFFPTILVKDRKENADKVFMYFRRTNGPLRWHIETHTV